jgi:hypothetical protein
MIARLFARSLASLFPIPYSLFPAPSFIVKE